MTPLTPETAGARNLDQISHLGELVRKGEAIEQEEPSRAFLQALKDIHDTTTPDQRGVVVEGLTSVLAQVPTETEVVRFYVAQLIKNVGLNEKA